MGFDLSKLVRDEILPWQILNLPKAQKIRKIYHLLSGKSGSSLASF